MFLAIVLALPPRLSRVADDLAVVAGVVLGLTAVLTVLDIGFLAALNRPFDALERLALRRISRGDRPGLGRRSLGIVLLVLAGLLIVVLLVLLPALGAAGHAGRVAHRARRSGRWRVLASLWLAFAVLEVRTETGPVASRQASAYVYGQVSRIPSELRDQRRVRPRRRDGPDAQRARRRSPDRPARQGRPDRVRRELRPRRGGGLQLRAGGQRGARLGHPASWSGPGSPAGARSSPLPPTVPSAGWRTRPSSRDCGSTASSATTSS